MSQFQKISLFLLRISTGWLLLYAGVIKLLDPSWSAAGYLQNAATFKSFYAALTSAGALPITNFLNEWGLTLLGVSLILGIAVRLSGVLGAVLMLLYYFPALTFPYIKSHSYLVDEHIVYALVLLMLAASRAGRVWGLEKWCAGLPICKTFPKLRALLG